jgi:hypothetical protein
LFVANPVGSGELKASPYCIDYRNRLFVILVVAFGGVSTNSAINDADEHSL